MNLEQFKQELMKDEKFAMEYNKFDLVDYLTEIRIKLGLSITKLLLIIIGIFILLMSIKVAVEIKDGYREASELERYLYDTQN